MPPMTEIIFFLSYLSIYLCISIPLSLSRRPINMIPGSYQKVTGCVNIVPPFGLIATASIVKQYTDGIPHSPSSLFALSHIGLSTSISALLLLC